MFGSDILDIIIGMVFVFTLLSLIASGASELLETIIKKRSKDLERGINELFGTDGGKFTESLYNHGLINSLYRGASYATAGVRLPSYIPSANFAAAVIDLINNPPAQSPNLPSNLVSALRTFEQQGTHDVAELQQRIEDWYNSAMDRVAGWYKRRAQWIILGLGFAIAIAINVDSVRLAKSLSHDQTLRKGIVAAAQAEASKPVPNAGATPPSQSGQPSSSVQEIEKEVTYFNGLGLPVGWPDPDWKSAAPNESVSGLVVRIVKTHVIGWLVTAFAISLGAPFWFDLLKKLVGVRASVKPGDSSTGGSK